jgi:hypothetical protein
MNNMAKKDLYDWKRNQSIYKVLLNTFTHTNFEMHNINIVILQIRK